MLDFFFGFVCCCYVALVVAVQVQDDVEVFD